MGIFRGIYRGTFFVLLAVNGWGDLLPEEVVRQYIQGSDQERQDAGKQLAVLRGKAVPALLRAYEDSDPWHRVWAVNGFGIVRHMSAFPALTLAMADADKKVRQVAITSLGRYGEPGFIALTMAFDDPRADRVALMGALLPFKQPSIVPYLIRALRHSEVAARENAAKSLGEFPDHPDVPEALAAALADPHPWVRDGAWQSSRKVGPAMVKAILPLLRHEKDDVRHSAVQALVYIRHPDTMPALTLALQDTFEKVRGLALVGLGQLKRAETVPAILGACLDASAPVRATALEQLRPFLTDETRAAVTRALQDVDPAVRDTARNILKHWEAFPPPRRR